MFYKVTEVGRRGFTDAFTGQKYDIRAGRVGLAVGGKTITIALENFPQAGYGMGFPRKCTRAANFYNAEFELEVHGVEFDAAAVGCYARNLGFNTELKETNAEKSIFII